MGTLFAKVGTLWEPIVGNIDEVWIGNTDPYIATPAGTWEVWYNTTTTPAVTNVRVAGVWVPSTEREIEISDIDPYVTNLLSTAEVWYDTSPSLEVPPKINVLKFRVNGAWELLPIPAAEPPLDEVWIDSVSPDPAGTFQLWYDLSSTPAILKAKMPNGSWQDITSVQEPPLDEVWVDTVSPDPAGTYQLWVDQNTVPPVLKYKNAAGAWIPVITPTPPTAYGGVTPATAFGQPPADGTAASLSRSDHFHGLPNVPPNIIPLGGVTPATVHGQPPADGTAQSVSRSDHFHGTPLVPNEVVVAPIDPYTDTPGTDAELWYDTTRNTLYAREGVEWVPVQTPVVLPKDAEEVTVGTVDPYVTDPSAVVDLWFNSAANVRALFVRVGNAWVPASAGYGTVFPQLSFGMPSSPGVSEEASRADHSHGTPPEPPGAALGSAATDVAPGVTAAGGTATEASRTDHTHGMKAYGDVVPEVTFGTLPRNGTDDTFSRGDHAHGVPPNPLPAGGLTNQVLTKSSIADYDAKWETAGGGANEVVISTSEPTDPAVELWYDTDETAATTEEVFVGPAEPPDPSIELWYDSDAVPTVPVHGMRAFWEPTVTYMPGDQVLWPKTAADVRVASRETVGEEPGLIGINDAMDFGDRGATPTVVQGLSALLTGADFSSGVDIRYHTGRYDWGAQWIGGFLLTATNSGNVPVFSASTVVDATTPSDLTLSLLRFTVLNSLAVPFSLDVPKTALDTVVRPFLRFTAEAATRTLKIYDSDDGVNWTELASVISPELLLLNGVTALHIGHDNDEPTHNWGGPQSEIEIYNFAGTLQSSWVAYTQPSNPDGPNYPDPAPDPVPAAGTGVSAKTGEDYYIVGSVGTVWLVDRHPAWSNVTSQVHWTNDFTDETIAGRDGYGIAFNDGSAVYKRSGGGIVIREAAGGTQPAIENFDGTARRDIIDTTNGDLRYARLSTFVMRLQTGLSITAGQYYYIGAVQNSGGADVVRISITAKSGNSIQAFDAVQNVNLNGQFGWTALLSPSASTGTKLFDRLGAYWHSGGARMKLRAVATATINIGWTAYNTMNGAAFGGSTWVVDTTGGTETGAVAL